MITKTYCKGKELFRETMYGRARYKGRSRRTIERGPEQMNPEFNRVVSLGKGLSTYLQ